MLLHGGGRDMAGCKGGQKINYQELYQMRVLMKLSLKQIAERMGLHQSTITKALARCRKGGWLYQASTDLKIGRAIDVMGSEGYNSLKRLNAQTKILEEENNFLLVQMKQFDPDKAECSRDVSCPECKHVFPVLLTNRDEVLSQRMRLQDRITKNAAEIRQQLETAKGVLKEAVKVAQLEQFMKLVFEAVGYESPEAQRRIIEGIKRARATGQFSGAIGQGS
jgi:predicted DNA-binding protein (UPF0251 family)